MKSGPPGKNTSEVEATNISKHGLWLLLGGWGLFLAFQDFLWFRNVPVGRLLNVELPHPHHLHWPDLDVDLSVESIEHPERFPLVSRKGPNQSATADAGQKRRRG
jgi:hypothetical protein